MLDQLLKIVQESSQREVVQNDQVPNELNAQVQQAISSSIQSGLSSAISSGNIGSVMELFSSGAKRQNVSGNPITNMIMDQVAKVLSDKFNLSPAVGKMIASSVVPGVMASFAQKVADPQDKSVDMNGLIGSLLGGGGQQAPSSGVDFNVLLQDLAAGKKGSNDLAGLAGQLLSQGRGGSGEQGNAGGLLGTLGKMLGR